MTRQQRHIGRIATMRQITADHTLATRIEHGRKIEARAKMLLGDMRQQIRDVRNGSSN